MQIWRFYLRSAVVFAVVATTAQGTDRDTFVRVNLLGYRPGDVKIGIVMSRGATAAEFQVIDAASKRVAFGGRCQALAEAWGEFVHHAELNFSRLETEGEYIVKVGNAESPRFRI